MIITIARECGCYGDEIGKRLSEELDIPFQNRVTICEQAKQNGIYEKYPHFFDEHSSNTYLSVLAETEQENVVRKIPYTALERVIGTKECIILGRCGNYVYREDENAIRVFLCGNKEIRIQRIMETHGLSRRKAEELVEKTDANRKAYHKYYTGEEWGYAGNYSICLDEGRIGVEAVVTAIRQFSLAMGL